MLNLNIEDGVQEINLNGKVTVLLNLTDTNFIERFFTAFESMDELQEEYSKELDKATDREAFMLARKYDADMRERINGAFGSDICTPLLGSVSTYAIAGGLPIWCNIMLALIEEINAGINEQKKLTNPKVQKYIAKYGRK